MIFKQSLQYRLSEREENIVEKFSCGEEELHIRPKEHMGSKYSMKIWSLSNYETKAKSKWITLSPGSLTDCDKYGNVHLAIIYLSLSILTQDWNRNP